MKTSSGAVGLTWTLFLVLLLAEPAIAQYPATAVRQPDSSAEQAEQDPLGRSTPYGTVIGFIRAAQRNDYDRAVQYLDTRKHGNAAEKLARQLETVLNRGLMADLDKLSRKPEGALQDGQRTTRDRVGTIDTPSTAGSE